MIEIVVDNRIRIPRAQLYEDVVQALLQEFAYKNPQYEWNKSSGLPFWNLPKKYMTGIADTKEVSLPRGGLQRVRDVLTEFDLEWSIEDRRILGAPDVSPEDIPDHLLTPYEHQEELVDAAREREQCLLKAPTGSGKTVVVFNLISRWKVPSLVVVPNSTLMRQWQKRIPIELGMDLRDVGIIKGRKTKLRPLTLAMPQTLSKRLAGDGGQDIRDYFGAVLCDEAQLFAADTFYRSIDPLPARYRIAVSADHTRKDRKEFLVYDLFGDVAKKITRKRLEKKGVILNVEIWVVPTKFRADWYGIPQVGEDGETNETELDFNRLLDTMLRDEDRNTLIYNVLRGVVEQEKKQILAFAHRREHVLMIDRTLSSYRYKTGFLLGGKSDEREFVRTVQGLESGTLDIGVGTYQSTGTGLDLPKIAMGLATTPIGGNRQFFNQVRGRFCRTIKDGSGEKTSARLYYLWDRHVYPSHLKNIAKWNDKVFVWTGTSWMPARHYLDSEKKNA